MLPGGGVGGALDDDGAPQGETEIARRLADQRQIARFRQHRSDQRRQAQPDGVQVGGGALGARRPATSFAGGRRRGRRHRHWRRRRLRRQARHSGGGGQRRQRGRIQRRQRSRDAVRATRLFRARLFRALVARRRRRRRRHGAVGGRRRQPFGQHGGAWSRENPFQFHTNCSRNELLGGCKSFHQCHQLGNSIMVMFLFAFIVSVSNTLLICLRFLGYN